MSGTEEGKGICSGEGRGLVRGRVKGEWYRGREGKWFRGGKGNVVKERSGRERRRKGVKCVCVCGGGRVRGEIIFGTRVSLANPPPRKKKKKSKKTSIYSIKKVLV